MYAKYLKKLKTIGLQPNIGEGVLDFSIRAAAILPQQKSHIMAIATRYNALMYSPANQESLLKELDTLINQFTYQSIHSKTKWTLTKHGRN